MSIALYFIHFVLLLTKEFHIAVASNHFHHGNKTRECAGAEIRKTLSGVITTPGFWHPQKYPPNCQYSWTFPLIPGKFVHFRFLEFHLEQYNSCLKDRLDVLSVTPSETRVVKRFCGFSVPNNVTVPANESIRLEFFSDDLYEFRGFQIEYNVQDGEDKCEAGFLKCKNMQCVAPGKVCDKIDDCKDGTDEENCGYELQSQTKCGSPAIQPVIDGLNDRIIGGSEAVPGSWPWQVSIHKANIFPSGHYCGGSILNSIWIITAGHCVQGQNKSSIRIHLGSHREFEDDEEESIRYPTKFVTHPKFSPRTLKNDIALIQMNAPVKFSKTISSICLPNEDYRVLNGTQCIVTGWGSTYGSGYAGVLKQAVVPVISNAECKVLSKKKIYEGVMCTGFKGEAPCHGDSGGPLVCRNLDHRWFLAGIVSTGPKLCGVRHEPSIFSETEFYLDWIKDIIGNGTL